MLGSRGLLVLGVGYIGEEQTQGPQVGSRAVGDQMAGVGIDERDGRGRPVVDPVLGVGRWQDLHLDVGAMGGHDEASSVSRTASVRSGPGVSPKSDAGARGACRTAGPASGPG